MQVNQSSLQRLAEAPTTEEARQILATLRTEEIGSADALLRGLRTGTRNGAVVLQALERILSDTFLTIAQGDAEPQLLCAALHSLAALAPKRACRVIQDKRLWQHSDRMVRQTVASALRDSKDLDGSAVDVLLTMAVDEDVLVQERAIESTVGVTEPDVLLYWERVAFWWEGTRWGDLAEACRASTRRDVARHGVTNCRRQALKRWLGVARTLLAEDDRDDRMRGLRLHVFWAPLQSARVYRAAQREQLARADLGLRDLLRARRLPVRDRSAREDE